VWSVVKHSAQDNPWGVDVPRWSQHPLPWRNTPSGGENHLTDATGRSVYDGADADEMFRLYAGAAQAAARRDTDHPRRHGSRNARAQQAGLVTQAPLPVAAPPVGGSKDSNAEQPPSTPARRRTGSWRHWSRPTPHLATASRARRRRWGLPS
jgi:hypothetical protein